MLQGTGSNVGKSVLVAGLCRALMRRGLSVRPFKPQNMSNNAAVAADGGEIGRAQALQARACGVPPSINMNPVLLKPETDTGSQVVVHGQRIATVKAREYAKLKPSLMAPVMQSFQRLSAEADFVIVEGAGSPAEVNLRSGDIANMGFAEAAQVPVILIGDIDRGGVIAQIVGTQVVLPPSDAALIKGFMINKFRGDPTLFDDGYALIEQHTGWPGLGVLPWFSEASRLPAEDVLDLKSHGSGHGLRIAVPQLSRIANFDDLDPLAMEPNISLEIIPPGVPLPADADLVILPGSKSTIGDLAFLRAQGWDHDLEAILRRGGRVLGICGGYQMLGHRLSDPQGIEGNPADVDGLGLLNISTVMTLHKNLTNVSGRHLASGVEVSGYEIHIGRSEGPDGMRPLFEIDGRPEGATSADGRIMGAYLHGIFANDAFRAAFIRELGGTASNQSYGTIIEQTLDNLANHLEAHCNIDKLLEISYRHSRR